VNVERLERLSIQILQLAKAGTHLRLGLVGHDAIERRCVFRACDVQHFVVGSGDRPAPRNPVDAQAARDHPQPTTECGRFPQGSNLSHGLQEHVLAQFLRLGIVVGPPPAVNQQLAMKQLVQPAERLAVAILGGDDERGDIGMRAQSRRGHEAGFRDRGVGFCVSSTTKR
jgi:hypothetical protein